MKDQSKGKIIAIHQPNFLPWMGYFAKVYRCDQFVIYDDTNFTKGAGYTHRAQLNSTNGPWWCTLPMRTAGRQDQLILEAKMADVPRWRAKMLKRVRLEYLKAPYFSEFFPIFEEFMSIETDSMLELNTYIIKKFLDVLDIKKEIIFSSSLGLKTKATQRLVDILKKVGGQTYLSGMGAKAYQEDELFVKNDLNLVYYQFGVCPYKQIHGKFQPGLSTLDVLFNVGVEETKKMITT